MLICDICTIEIMFLVVVCDMKHVIQREKLSPLSRSLYFLRLVYLLRSVFSTKSITFSFTQIHRNLLFSTYQPLIFSKIHQIYINLQSERGRMKKKKKKGFCFLLFGSEWKRSASSLLWGHFLVFSSRTFNHHKIWFCMLIGLAFWDLHVLVFNSSDSVRPFSVSGPSPVSRFAVAASFS